MAADNGGIEKAMNFARYFPVPGMNHCAGGPALDNFDALGAVMQWVENGKLPAAWWLLARSSPTSLGRCAPGQNTPNTMARVRGMTRRVSAAKSSGDERALHSDEDGKIWNGTYYTIATERA